MNFLSSIANSKFGFAVKKHSPEIMLIAGLVTGAGALVLACRATLKADRIIKKNKEKIDEIKKIDKDEEFVDENGAILPYTEEERKKDISILKRRNVLSTVKEYAPAVILGGLSATLIIASHVTLKNRYLATAAALTSLGEAFLAYRQRVAKKYGKEEEYKLLHGIEEVEVEETIIDSNGNELVTKKKVEVATEESPYVRYFKKGNPHWTSDCEKDEDQAAFIIGMLQAKAHSELCRKGWLTLNDAYDICGFNGDKGGLVVGWLFDKEHGDCKVQLSWKKTKLLKDDGKSYEVAYAIDFNVDGEIYTDMV